MHLGAFLCGKKCVIKCIKNILGYEIVSEFLLKMESHCVTYFFYLYEMFTIANIESDTSES